MWTSQNPIILISVWLGGMEYGPKGIYILKQRWKIVNRKSEKRDGCKFFMMKTEENE